MPADPVDSLADFLLEKADDIDRRKISEREAAVKAKQEAKKAKAMLHH